MFVPWRGQRRKQGLGDSIQMLRFIRPLYERGANILLIVHNAIRPLVHDWSLVKLLKQGEDLTGVYDHWVAIMSLPLMLGVKEASDIPPPWMAEPSDERKTHWEWEIQRATGSPHGERFRVGICWAGQFQHKNNRHRSVPLKVLSTLFEAEKCDFISFQQMRPEDTQTFAELQKKHENLSAPYFDDFRDTAAAMRCCDLVISADTAVAHLAGSLGAPTWILIPKFGTDWRWTLTGEETPWYPSARLTHCIPKHKSSHRLSKKCWSLSKKMQVSISVHCKARQAHAYQFSRRRSRRR
jgi:hypothetical protein